MTLSDTGPTIFGRRQALLGLAGAGLALAGCRSNASSAEPADASTASGGASTSASGTFPATVTHKYGQTTVSAQPKRVVSVGITEQDFLLALGTVPIGVTEWYGNKPQATWPWARAALGSAKPTVLSQTDGLQFERIAALAPDLIIGTNAALSEKDYDRLSKIAPTVANSGKFSSGYFEPWDVQTELIGAALGIPAAAEATITALKQKFTDAAKANPQLTGTTVIFSQGGTYQGNVIASQAGLGTAFLTDLGLAIPPELTPFSKDGNQAYIPLEKLDVLDNADVLIWATDETSTEAALKKTPGFSQLKAVKAGRSIYTGAELSGAIYFASPLSLPVVIEQLVPRLTAVL